MAKKWSAVIQTPEYQQLNPHEKEAARKQYFKDVIKPQVSFKEIDDVRDQFDADTKPAIDTELTTLQSKANKQFAANPNVYGDAMMGRYTAPDGQTYSAGSDPNNPAAQYVGDWWDKFTSGTDAVGKEYSEHPGKSALLTVPAIGSTAMNLVTSIGAPVFAGVDKGLSKLGWEPSGGEQSYEDTKKKYTWDPELPLAKGMTATVGGALKPVGDVLSVPGKIVADATGSEVAGDVTTDIVNTAAVVLPLKAKAAKSAAKAERAVGEAAVDAKAYADDAAKLPVPGEYTAGQMQSMGKNGTKFREYEHQIAQKAPEIANLLEGQKRTIVKNFDKLIETASEGAKRTLIALKNKVVKKEADGKITIDADALRGAVTKGVDEMRANKSKLDPDTHSALSKLSTFADNTSTAQFAGKGGALGILKDILQGTKLGGAAGAMGVEALGVIPGATKWYAAAKTAQMIRNQVKKRGTKSEMNTIGKNKSKADEVYDKGDAMEKHYDDANAKHEAEWGDATGFGDHSSNVKQYADDAAKDFLDSDWFMSPEALMDKVKAGKYDNLPDPLKGKEPRRFTDAQRQAIEKNTREANRKKGDNEIVYDTPDQVGAKSRSGRGKADADAYLSEIESMGKVTGDEIKIGNSTVRLTKNHLMDEPTVHIEAIEVPAAKQGNGVGGAALDLLIKRADAKGVALTLQPKAFGKKGLSDAQLTKWYEDRGFEMLPDSLEMIRRPKKKD